MATFTHTAPIGIDQLNNTFYVWGNGVGFNTIQEAVDYVRTQAGVYPGEIVVVHGHGYGEDIPSITGGALGIPIVDQRDERNQRYYWDGAKYTPKPFEQLSGFIAHGIPQILDGGVQYRGGLLIGYDPTGTSGAGNATLNVAGEPGAAAPTIELAVQQNGSPSHVLLHSDDQTINLYPLSGNVFVNGSLIRTAANSPYPPVGIPQSTGSAWGASINPATLQGKLTVTTTGTSGPSTLVGNTLNIPQYAGTSGGMVYPDAGIGVSTGTAWGASIDPATIPSLTAPLNQFTGDITGGLNCVGSNTFPTLNQGNLKITWNISNGSGETDFLNCNGGAGGGFRWYNGASAAAVTSTNQSLMYLHGNSGRLDVPGGIAVGAAATGLLEVASGNLRLASTGGTATAAGAIIIHGNSSDLSRSNDWITCYDDGAYQTLVKGNFTVTGGTKAFMVPHPLDETKDLYHACLEGPENGVFYRGEVVTANGTAEVTLPDYFEALTYPEDRSVQLTQVFEAGAVLTMLAASRVVDGKFTVQSSAPIATVAWEVKAVRRIGVERLQVTQTKREPLPAATFENAAAEAAKEPQAKTKKGKAA